MRPCFCVLRQGHVYLVNFMRTLKVTEGRSLIEKNNVKCLRFKTNVDIFNTYAIFLRDKSHCIKKYMQGSHFYI